MRAVTEVADPCLQCGRVVLPDNFAVRLYGSVAGDGCPLAGWSDEGDIDGRVRLEVVGLAGFGVGVEEELEAVALLYSVKIGTSSHPMAG